MEESQYCTRKLTTLGFDTIFPHLDVYKRFELSLHFPEFRKYEQSKKINHDTIILTPSSFTINDRRYKFGEIQEFEKAHELSLGQLSEAEIRLQDQNLTGGREWESAWNDLTEKGDVRMDLATQGVLEQQREEKLPILRQRFYETIEKHWNYQENVNPLAVFKELVERRDRTAWPRQIAAVFANIGTPPFSSEDIGRVYEENPVVDYERDGIRRDDVSKTYPIAYEQITKTIEKLKSSNDPRYQALQRVAYAPIIIPHFNKFSVLRLSDFPYFSNRLPEDVSIRHAVKKFMTKFLGGRNGTIRVGKLEIDGYGILPLPVGLKLDCDDVTIRGRERTSLKFISRMLSRATRINIFASMVGQRRDDIISFPKFQRFNCETLQIVPFTDTLSRSYFRKLSSRNIYFGLTRESKQRFFDILLEWLRNLRRAVGSRLVLAFERRIESFRIDGILDTERLIEIGFVRDNPGRDSWRLPIPQIANRFVEMTKRYDMTLFSEEFSRKINSHKYYHFEFITL